MLETQATDYDVIIIGGGPAGTTAGTLLRKYHPELRVALFEREKFPREHIGESQLPPIGAILTEMGCWDKVESAQFPIKVGATYRWGHSPDLWDFEFLPLSKFRNEPRPARYEGQRRLTALQVERAIYDDILLRHAESMGVEVHEQTGVSKVHHDGDSVTGLDLSTGRHVRARFYLDGSGHYGLLRRALGVGVTVPTKLKNVAFWDYWDNADWAVEIGVGGTRIQILSIGCGWIWFIPLGPTRTSIGFVCPGEYYKACGKSPEELYAWALSQESRVQALTRNATRENRVRSTKDWSFVADRWAGENWLLMGEAGGFADPILSGGMTLAHTSAREAAYIVPAILSGEHDAKWLKRHYEDVQSRRVRQYIRFADFWYAANGQFTDLEEHTARIAKESGLKLTPQAAFRWLSFGGFAHEDWFLPGLGGLDLLAVKEVTKLFTTNEDPGWELNKYNVWQLNLVGAKVEDIPIYHQGKIARVKCWRRGGQLLPYVGMYRFIVDLLKETSDAQVVAERISLWAASRKIVGGVPLQGGQAYGTIEAMLLDGWIKGKVNKKKPLPNYRHTVGDEVRGNFHPNRDHITIADVAADESEGMAATADVSG